MKEMRSKAIVVLVNSKTGGYSALPTPVKEQLNKPEMGNYIPKLAVSDKEGNKSLGGIGYKQMGDKKLMRKLENSMRDYIKSGAPSSDESEEEESDSSESDSEESESKLGKNGEISDGIMTVWTSTKGTKIKARATHFTGGKLSLLRDNGTTIKVALDQLDAESQEQAKELIGG